MKRETFIFAFVLAILVFWASWANAQHYYCRLGQIPLSISDSIVTVKFYPGAPQTQFETFAYEVECLDEDYPPEPWATDFWTYHTDTTYNIDSIIAILMNHPSVLFAFPAYKNSCDITLKLCDLFIVSFKDSVSQVTIDSLYDYYAIEQLEGPLTYTGTRKVVITSQSEGNTLNVANILYESGLVRFSQPIWAAPVPCDFVPDDPLFIHQYYLNNTEYPAIDIDVQKAWEITQGSPDAYIFVIDAGCDDVHEDINGSRVLWDMGYDYVGDYCYGLDGPYFPDPDPNPGYYSAHGVACQGILTARLNNGLGISGIAPECWLIPLKIFDDCGVGRIDPTPVENAIRHVIDFVRPFGESAPVVVSCSWGYELGVYYDNIAEILDSAVYYEIPFVFASGNYGKGHAIGHSMSFPAKLETTIGVGAVNPDGTHWIHSGSGEGIDVVAPTGGIYTTDRMGEAGFNPHLGTCDSTDANYMCFFGGTSAAAPQVSGTLALVRSRRTDIGSFDTLRMIVDSSAVDGLGDELDTLGWDPAYGYGLANALRALLAVCRGDPNNSGEINLMDATYIINYLYKNGPEPEPHMLMADANCDSIINIMDPTYIVNYLYEEGPPPPICFKYGSYWEP
jgi:subtilisin family serine protease